MSGEDGHSMFDIDLLNLDNFILYIRFYGVLSLQNLSAMIEWR